jgi:hypothetical protein
MRAPIPQKIVLLLPATTLACPARNQRFAQRWREWFREGTPLDRLVAPRTLICPSRSPPNALLAPRHVLDLARVELLLQSSNHTALEVCSVRATKATRASLTISCQPCYSSASRYINELARLLRWRLRQPRPLRTGYCCRCSLACLSLSAELRSI